MRIIPAPQGTDAPEFLGIVERLCPLSSPLPQLCCGFVIGDRAMFRQIRNSDVFSRNPSTHSGKSTYLSTPFPCRSLLGLALGRRMT